MNYMQIWDLDDILQNPSNATKTQAAVEDSDSDGMDVDDNPPKSNKGILFSSGDEMAMLDLFIYVL